MESVILARHGESVFSERKLMNGDASRPGALTRSGEDEARALGAALSGEQLDLCVTTAFERTRQTADLALAGRDVPRVVVAELNDPLYGEYEGGPLEEYRAWVDGRASHEDVPGGGESRASIVRRYAAGFRTVLDRPEERVLVVAHSLPIAYALSARDGTPPAARVELVAHAHPYPLSAPELERAVDVLESWCASPTW
jgi:probable phosphoglycerate mutase